MKRFLDTFTQDYLDDILVRLAHHSAGIEGNTISLPATVSIILNGTLPTSGKATVREFYEIENHKQAFEHVIQHLANEDSLSIEIIKEIHADLTDRLQYNRGQFKKNENMDLRTDKLALQRLKEAAEKAKIELSSAAQTEINLPFITARMEGGTTTPLHLVQTVTRSDLEKLVDGLIKRTLEP